MHRVQRQMYHCARDFFYNYLPMSWLEIANLIKYGLSDVLVILIPGDLEIIQDLIPAQWPPSVSERQTRAPNTSTCLHGRHTA